MGLMDFLSPALTAASTAAGASAEGQREGSALLRQIMMQQSQMDRERAQTAKDYADTQHTLHINQAPVLGEAGYNEANAGKVGAEEAAKSPYVVRNAVETKRLTAPIEVQQKYDEAIATLPIEIQKKVKEGQISLANGITLAKVHGTIQGGLQKDAQKAARDLQATGQAGSFANAVGLKKIEAANSMTGRIINPNIPDVTPAQAPSNRIGLPPTTTPKAKTGNIFLDQQDEQ